MYSYKKYSIKNFPVNENKNLYYCSLRSGGYLWTEFLKESNKNCPLVVCRDGERVIGWGIRVFINYYDVDPHFCIMIYVDVPYRRQGIGTKIVNLLKKNPSARISGGKIQISKDGKNDKFINSLNL